MTPKRRSLPVGRSKKISRKLKVTRLSFKKAVKKIRVLDKKIRVLDRRSKKKRRKLKVTRRLFKKGLKKVRVPEQISSQGYRNSSECYTPMDICPDDREPVKGIFDYQHGSSHDADCPPKGFVYGPETASLIFSQGQAYSSNDTNFALAEDFSASRTNVESRSEVAEQDNQGFSSSVDSSLEACKAWRLRGNQAYKNGNLSQAEEFYTQGISSVPLSETAGCHVKPLVLCYSNLALTRMSLGRIRDALEDCAKASEMDPNFYKVRLREAKCYLLLGELESAVRIYNHLSRQTEDDHLKSRVFMSSDNEIAIEITAGLLMIQKVVECTDHSAELLQQKTWEAAYNASEKITEALSISLYSEKLLEMKAEALYMLPKYQEAIQLCVNTLSDAENNFAANDNCSLAKLWRWRLMSKSYFNMGNLEAALELLSKPEQVRSVTDTRGEEILESLTTFAATIRELLHHKDAGNEAFRSGKYTEAVKHYNNALSKKIESRPFTAICLCNRAAALQALGQIADAIADCSLAMAFDGSYTKAVSRRATLHEEIGDYFQAATDLRRLVSILENQSDEKAKQFGSQSSATGSEIVTRARQRMSLMENEARKGLRLDFHLILGVKTSDAASNIKKAYKKAALRHHPDKACQLVPRTESGDGVQLPKDIADEARREADRLFKMITEAYAVVLAKKERSERF